MKFHEFVAIKDEAFQQPGQQGSVQDTLAKAAKAPVPPGANPAVVQQKLRRAMTFAQMNQPKSASQAVDGVNALDKAVAN